MTEGPDAGFFPLLKSGKPAGLNAAFLLTRPITARSGNPDDPKSMSLNNDTGPEEGAEGELANFKESILPRLLFKKAGAEKRRSFRSRFRNGSTKKKATASAEII